ncbi:MAG: hypothetical protein GKS00_19155 [Alphaproteobacteria bacterium]|nr:hypothetical protein [Alphaproteobacteria bacterium]
MTVISTNLYTPQLASYLANADTRPQPNSTPAASNGPSSAINVTLSQEAVATFGDRSISTVIADAKANLSALLTATNKTSPLENGKLAVDLSKFNRRELYAIATNAGEQFPPDQQAAAVLELQRRFDSALAGPAAVQRITGDFKALYQFASDYLDAAGPEEKASSVVQNRMTAVREALAHLADDPDQAPHDIANDPVADYLDRTSKGETVNERDFSDITNDVRAVLDKQYADAKTEEETRRFGDNRREEDSIDLSRFGGRSLSAIVLNSGSKFDTNEIHAAKTEVNSRVSNIVLEAFKRSNASNDPTAFSKNLIAQYNSLSIEEREAAGLTPAYYNTILSNHETSVKLAEAFSAFAQPGGTAQGSGVFSLLQFL